MTIRSVYQRYREPILVAAGQGAVAIGSLATVRLLTHLLGPSEYGVLAVALTYVIAAVNILVGPVTGLATNSFHEAVRDGRARRLVTVLAMTAVALAVIPAIVVPLAIAVVRPEFTSIAFVAGVLFAGDMMKTPAIILANVARRRELFAVLSIADGIGRVVTIFLFVEILSADIHVVLIASALNSFLVAAAGWPAALRPLHDAPVTLRDATRGIGATLLQGWSFAGIGLAGWLINISDRAVLGALRPAAEVGLYVAVYQITGFLFIAAGMLVTQIGQPVVMQRYATDKPAAAALVGRLMRYLLLLTVPIAVLTIAAREPMLRLIAGEPFLPAAGIVPWLAGGFLLMAMTNVASIPFVMAKRTGTYFGVATIAGVVNVIANLIFVPHLGYLAAAINTPVTYGVQLLLCLAIGRRFVPWKLDVFAGMTSLRHVLTSMKVR